MAKFLLLLLILFLPPIMLFWWAGIHVWVTGLTFVYLGLSVLLLFFKKIRSYLSKINDGFTKLLKIDDFKAVNNHGIKPFVDTFGFDYVVFSPIDFLNYKIESKHWYCNPNTNLGEADPEKWAKKSNYELYKTDILNLVAKGRKRVVVINNKIINDSTIDASKVLNDEIKDRHKNIARLFLPVVYRSDSAPDLVLGVIELGFKNRLLRVDNPTFTRVLRYLEVFANYSLPLKFISLLIPNLGEMISLQPYLSLFARRYHRLYIQELQEEILKYVLNKENRELEIQSNPRVYLQKALDRLTEKLNANYGIIAFQTFNHANISFTDQSFISGANTEDITAVFREGEYPNTGKRGITNYVLKEGKSYFSGNVLAPTEPHYLLSLDKNDIVSEIGIPLFKDKKVIGVLLLDSQYPDYFNQIHQLVLEYVTKKLMPEYFRKKRYYIYEQLTIPSQVWETSQDLYKAIANMLGEYFDAQHIAIWIKNPQTVNTFVLCSKSTHPTTYSPYKNQQLTEIESSLDYRQDKKTIRVIESESRDTKFGRIAANNGFKAYLSIGIVVQEKYEAFINILSKRPLDPETSEREQTFLNQVANKISISSQGLKLVHSFSTIATNLSNPSSPSKTRLQNIVDTALEVTNADIVAFFPYSDKDILLSEETCAGFSIARNEASNGKQANLANLIMTNGTQWFSTQEQYEQFLVKNNVSIAAKLRTAGFREINNIVSSAIVCIEHQGVKKGVIFFNYRNEIRFEDRINLKRLIGNFADFLGLHLVNRGLLDEIRETLQATQRQKVSLDREVQVKTRERDLVLREFIRKQKELQEIETQLADVLPRATRTSFYQILEGINHNIKHTLFEIWGSQKKIDTARLNSLEKQIVDTNIRNTNTAIYTIETLLELFDFDTQEKEMTDVNQIIQQLIKFFKINEYGFIKFDTDFKTTSLPILLNKAEITMIFYNIMVNALHTLLEKRENNPTFEGVIKVHTQERSNTFVISFEDNGMGIDASHTEAIFKRGFTTKKNETQSTRKGTGIGLYFVKDILEKEYQSNITVKSRVGHGTTFTITIPKYINYQ